MSTSPLPPRTASPTDPSAQAFDIGKAIDRGRWTGLQKAALALVSLVVVLDGFDNQLLGFSVPLIAEDFGAARSAFSWIFALGYAGVGVGTAVGGLVGDRIGRKNVLLLATGVFGVFTLLSALSTNVTTLGIMRIAAGVGLGMVFPATAALTAEFTLLRRRSLAVALSIVCIPVGGLLGGLVAAPILPCSSGASSSSSAVWLRWSWWWSCCSPCPSRRSSRRCAGRRRTGSGWRAPSGGSVTRSTRTPSTSTRAATDGGPRAPQV